MAEGVPELVRVDVNASVPAAPLDHLVDAAGRHRAAAHAQPQRARPGHLVLGTLALVAVERAGRVVGEPDRPLLVALARDNGLAVARGDVVRRQPGQLGQPGAGVLEHRDDGVVAAVLEAAALGGAQQRSQFVVREDGNELVADLRRLEAGHRVRALLVGVLGGVPLEELLERAELVVGVGVRIAAQKGDRPLLDLLRPDSVPAREASRDQVLSSEPLRRLEVGADRLGRFLLGPKVEVPAVDHGLELASVEVTHVAPADLLGRFPGHAASVKRKLDKRCAHRADGAPGSVRRRFRRSETLCGQGQDRTVDLPLFRRSVADRRTIRFMRLRARLTCIRAYQEVAAAV